MVRTARSAFPLLLIVLVHLFFLTDGAMLGCGWFRDSCAGQPVGCGKTVKLQQALGGAATDVLRQIDALGQSDDDTTGVGVVDATAPPPLLAVSPTVLWPPNHKLVPVTVTVAAAEAGDSSPTLRLASITDNEGELANGSGHTSPDIQDAQFGTDDRQFLLRAERRAFGPGRIYTITYDAEDANGNLTTRRVTLWVP
jgi:endo-1,4-beta-xylanase